MRRGQPGRSAVRRAARDCLAALDGRAYTAPKFFARWACWRSPSNLISRMRISGCAAPPNASRAAMFPTPGRSTWGARRWADGIRKRCAAWRAINCFSRRRHYSARHLWPVLVAQLLWGAVAVRHGRGLAWARGKMQGLRHFSAAGMQKLQKDPELLEQILRSNEQIHSECKSGYILEAVFSAHRWGIVTHE